MREEIENMTLRPCVHDPRYDASYKQEKEREPDSENKFEVDDVLFGEGGRVRVASYHWDGYEWIYNCEAVDENSSVGEYMEHELSA